MVQQRNIALCIILSFVTCGIYALYWFICLNNDVNTVAKVEDGTSGGMALVLSLVTCGIYALYWTYKQGEKLDSVRGTSNSGIIYLVLTIFGLGIVAYALQQDALNKLAA